MKPHLKQIHAKVLLAALAVFGPSQALAQYGGPWANSSRVIGFERMVDASGAMFTWGGTSDSRFPVTSNAYQRVFPNTVCGYDDRSRPVLCTIGYIARLSPAGDQILWATFLGGTKDTGIQSLALDSRGDVWVLGKTESADLPLTPNALQRTPSPTFLAELSADGSKLLYSTFLGEAVAFPGGPMELGTKITIDSQDHVYIIGESGERFEATPGAYRSGPTAGTAELYVRKFDPSTNSLVYATLIGPGPNVNYEGSVNDLFLACTTDENGVLYIAFNTNRSEYPITPGVYSHRSAGQDILLTAVNPSGTGLVFSTVIGGSGDDYLTGMLRDAAGNFYLAGTTGGQHIAESSFDGLPSPDFPVTPDAMQAKWGAAFVMKLSPDASELLYSSFFGRSSPNLYSDLTFPQQIKLDEHGRLHMLVYSQESDVPLTPDSFSPCYPDVSTGWFRKDQDDPSYYSVGDHWAYVRFTGDLKGIEYATAIPTIPNQIGNPLSPYLFDTSGNFYIPSNTHYFDIVNYAQARHSGPVCVAESVTKTLGLVSPGLLVTIYGPDIGPSQPTSVVAAGGMIPEEVAGVQVMFDNLPAPILGAGPAQIDVVVPFGIPTTGTTTITVLRDGNVVGTLTNGTAPATPWLFSVDGTGYGAAGWNADGTPNSPDHPAHAGDIVTFYATGIGAMSPPPADGTIPPVPLSVPLNTTAVQGHNMAESCSYVGDAPGQVEGVVQLNCKVDNAVQFNNLPGWPIWISTGGVASVFQRNLIYTQ